MHVICRFQLHIVAAPGSAVSYGFYGFNELRSKPDQTGVLFSDRVCVCVHAAAVAMGRCGMSSLPGSLPLAPLQPLSGRGFSDLYARFVYFCLPEYSGWCVSLTHTPHIPHLSRYLKTLRAGSSFILLPHLSCHRYFSFFTFSCLASCFPSSQSWEAHETHNFHDSLFHSDCFPLGLQLYGEYREQLGNFARREAARLLTERQWRRQAGDNTTATGRRGHGRRHHHHHPTTLESHHSHASSTKKPRPYSKCQGDHSNTHIQSKLLREFGWSCFSGCHDTSYGYQETGGN